MRILHLLDIPWHSGLADYALRLAALERGAGHTSWVAVRPDTPAARAAERLGIPCVGCARLSDWAGLRRFLRAERIEICNAHTGATHTLAALALAGTQPGMRQHGPSSTSGAAALIRTRSDARPVRLRPLSRWLARRTAFYVGATRTIADQFVQRLVLPAGRVRVIYPAVSSPDRTGPPRDAASESRGHPVVTLVGRLDPVKGHAVFLEAAARVRQDHPAARFVVVGREEHVSVPELRALGDRLGLGGAVRFHGAVPNVTPWMENSTLGVIPSLASEAVSRVALEWAAHGRAVVASAVGGLPEFVLQERTGILVPPGQPGPLAEALSRLLSDPSRREVLADAARQRAADLFSPARLLRESITLYEEARCRS